MLRELAVIFPEVRQTFEEFDRVLVGSACGRVGPLIFPPPAFSESAREDAIRRLMETDVAQPAVGAACVAMLRLLRGLGCEPALVGGHSFGELVALHAAGAYDARALAELSSERGRLMKEAGAGQLGRDGGPASRSRRSSSRSCGKFPASRPPTGMVHRRR